MRALLNDLRLRDRRDVPKDILEHAVPTTLQDVVIIRHRQRPQERPSRSGDLHAEQDLQPRCGRPDTSAIQITTAADLVRSSSGFIRQEDIPPEGFS
jgi:hypothetical protein